ncbi:E3 ubiquitin-protein ligase MIB2-like [Amphiura filiformis]|uniref:E3 ubiquitin-protein ligase MIB2-like n=1 Tax=Amphiura filiformis TaxID=82378 RepID=UPI003B223D29
MFYGVRVVRGSNWRWGDQDGGEGHVGTVIVPTNINETDSVWVHWDSGRSANYNGGLGKTCDLRVYDNAPLGVKHKGVRCDACTKWDIEGLRWKCTVCDDFDLCSNCYTSDHHDMSHRFWRIDVPGAARVPVPSRQGSSKFKAKGIFAGAKVKRGLHWEWGDQDGGPGSTGTVTHIADWEPNTYRCKVRVQWPSGQANNYRMGHNGKVDVRYIQEGYGGFYYRDHLPELDLGKTPFYITSGDQVKVKDLSLDKMKAIQQRRCGWKDDMASARGSSGVVRAVDKDGDIKVEMSTSVWFFDAMCLLPEKKGDGGSGAVVPSSTADGGGARQRGGEESVSAEQLGQLFGLMLLKELVEGTGGGSSPKVLVAAAAKGDVSKVKELVSSNPRWVDFRDDDKGYTALHVSSHEGHIDVVKVLVAANANLEIKDADGDTALAFSCYGNKPSITRFLLERGSSVHAVNRIGKSSLHTAVGKGNSACASILINQGANVNLRDNEGNTPMMTAIESEDESTIDVLADHPRVDFTIKNNKGFNSIHHAAFKGSAYATQRMASKCSQRVIEEKKFDGFTAMHLAAINDHADVARALVQRGNADINCRNNKRETPLHLACNEGNNSTIEYLVNAGADVNAQDEDGDTPLHTMLMKQSVRDVIGRTPMGMLLQALDSGDTSTGNTAAVALFLIKNGANIYQRNHQAKTVLDYVANPTLENLLKQAHAQARLKQRTRVSITMRQKDDCIIS